MTDFDLPYIYYFLTRDNDLDDDEFEEARGISYYTKKALKIKFSMLSDVGEATRTPDLSLRRRLHYPLCYTNLYEKAC